MITPWYQDAQVALYHGNALDVLAALPAASVQCVVSSPPYWGLRDYGSATWLGGEAACRHIGDGPEIGNNRNLRGANDPQPPGRFRDVKAATDGHQRASVPIGGTCYLCGARRVDDQLGLEATPDAYVARLVAVFREVRRVLRDDGTVWVNLGDSYAGHNLPGWRPGNEEKNGGASNRNGVGIVADLKPKHLVGIPWRVAFALQADGWYLRADIIWAKPNPMPESVTDRPTKSHEYVFLLSKSERYFWDQEAVRERHSDYGDCRRLAFGDGTFWGHNGKNSGAIHLGANPSGRNLRTVWTLATAPYPEAHFATFPPDLVVPCVKAGTSEYGACAGCGAPWARVVSTTPMVFRHSAREAVKHAAGLVTALHGTCVTPATHTTTGWAPTCGCGRTDVVPCVVLDPFCGSGTACYVAKEYGRRAIGIDLVAAYLALARDRLVQDVFAFAR